MNDHHSASASQLLRDATDDLTVDVDRLVRGGIARGRTVQRRHRVGTAFAAAAVVGVIGVAASVGPGVAGKGEPATPTAFADDGQSSFTPPPETRTSAPPSSSPSALPVDRRLVIAAVEVPAAIAELLPQLRIGEIRAEAEYPLVDERQHIIVHFDAGGTLTTFVIERADSLASCGELAGPAIGGGPGDEPGVCSTWDGLEQLTWGPTTADGVTAQGVMVWQHGYIVSVVSYNAAEGKEVEPLTELPPLSAEDLMTVARSEIWFG